MTADAGNVRSDGDARVARWAKAAEDAGTYMMGAMAEATVGVRDADDWVGPASVEAAATFLVPVADEELAELRAEIERLRAEVQHLEDGFEEGSAELAGLRVELERLRSADLDAAAHRECKRAIVASPAPEGTTAEGIYWLTEKLADARAEGERWKAKYQQEWLRAENATRNLAESTPVFRGWRSFSDGSRTDVERWVRAANGDWVSLDSERRTDGDIILEHFSSAPDPEAPRLAFEALVSDLRELIAPTLVRDTLSTNVHAVKKVHVRARDLRDVIDKHAGSCAVCGADPGDGPVGSDGVRVCGECSTIVDGGDGSE